MCDIFTEGRIITLGNSASGLWPAAPSGGPAAVTVDIPSPLPGKRWIINCLSMFSTWPAGGENSNIGGGGGFMLVNANQGKAADDWTLNKVIIDQNARGIMLGPGTSLNGSNGTGAFTSWNFVNGIFVPISPTQKLRYIYVVQQNATVGLSYSINFQAQGIELDC